MSAYTVSIDRSAKRYAIFHGFDIVKEFEAYTVSEDDLKVQSWEWIKEHHPDVASVEYVFPVVSKVTYTRKVRHAR